MDKDSLAAYRKKRNFDKSDEPRGGADGHVGFVIQKHDASQLHYDVRLAIDGVLKSWAVPKGPSTDPAVKRLAIQVEDHPLDYADFEGVIAKGQYGAGTVMIWDRGDYTNLRADKDDSLDMLSSWKAGLIEVYLQGEKISGGYALKRIRAGDKPQWLLVKMKDEAADARRNPVSTEPNSVKSDQDMRGIRKANESD